MTLGSSAMMPRRLLIVGDPALSRGLMKMVLSRLGYVVTCVVSGQESLMALTHSQFALALIALQLPDLPGYLGTAPAARTPAHRIDADHSFRGCLGSRPDRGGLPRGLSAQADLDRASGLL